MKVANLDMDARYSVSGWRGIAFWIHTYDAIEDPGRVVVVMVGDDKKWNVSVDDLTPLQDGEWCPSCGQIGCTHGLV